MKTNFEITPEMQAKIDGFDKGVEVGGNISGIPGRILGATAGAG